MTAITHTTRSAYMMAFHRRLSAHWPTITLLESERLYRDVLGVPFGTHGYVWSVSSAIELADSCVEAHCA